MRCRGGIKLPHLNGIIVSDKARIGSNCTIFHQVTLGISSVPGEAGAPTIMDNAMIGAGAKVIGDVVVGEFVAVGANAVVTKDVPAHTTVIGCNKLLDKK